jgi:short-subunit dehydrogenase
MESLENRHVVITGASTGIGEALARECARRGARLTLVARRRELLSELGAACGVRHHVIARDLSEAPAEDWLDAAEAELGPVDVLVNNAGMENTGRMVESSVENAERLLHLNLVTPLLITRRLLPRLATRGGAIVNVASVAALAPAPLQAWYAASKAGLAAFSEALRSEFRTSDVQVVTVYPGPVTTPMAEAAYAKLGGRKGAVGMLPEGKADVLARRICHALARQKPRVIYPRFYVIARWAPWFARWVTDSVPLPETHGSS